jgi:O-antigen/teichoic acid export membrane protein
MSTDAAAIRTGPADLAGRAPRAPTLTRRASLNAVQSLLDYSAKLGVGLVITPIMVAGLGRSLFGVWEMLNRLVTYMSAADGRPTEALRLLVSSRQAVEDDALQRRAVGAALLVWVLFLPLIAAVGAILIWIAPTITHVAPALHAGVRAVTALLLLSFFLTLVAGVPESVLRGMNLGYRRMGLQASLNVLSGLLTVIAVRAGLGLVGLGGAQVGVAAVTGVLFWLLAQRYVRWFGVARPSRADVMPLLSMSAWLTVGEAVAKLLLACDVIILGWVVSPAVVTTYVLTGYAARTAIGIHVFAAGAAMPGLGGLIGRGEQDRAAVVRRELLTLTWLFATTVGVTILCWNRAFLGLWVGQQNYGGPWLDLLIILTAVQTVFIRTDAYVIDAALRPRPRVLAGAGAALVTIALAVPLTRVYGAVGLCIGLLCGRAVQSAAYPLLVRDSLGGRGEPRRGEAARLAVVTVLLFAAALWIGQRLRTSHWVVWGAGVALTAALAFLTALFVGPSSDVRRLVLTRLRALRPALGW